MEAGGAEFEVLVGKEDFKFSAAHFVAFEGFRERLHGHNYHVIVKLKGKVGPDGYVVDFGDVKKATRKVCKSLNERFLCPCRSDVMDIRSENGQVTLTCQDGAVISVPEADCAMLPLVHSTAERLARYIFTQLCIEFTLGYLHSRQVYAMDVSVGEMPKQEALYRRFSQPKHPVKHIKSTPMQPSLSFILSLALPA